MNKTELGLLDIEALLESSAILAEELRRSGAVTPGATVDELCRRLRAAKEALLIIDAGSTSAEPMERFRKNLLDNFGIDLY